MKKIDSGRLFSDDALNSEVMETVDVRDRHLVTEIVYGTLRRKAPLDHVLAGASSRLWQDVDGSAKILLRMSLYQLWFMDRIPDHAVVYDAVALAKKHLKGNIHLYLNGILRHLTRSRPWKADEYLKDTPKWIQVSLPRWLWKRWARRYGEDEAASYAESLNFPPDRTLRLTPRAEIGSLPFHVSPSELVPGAYVRDEEAKAVCAGIANAVTMQDEASQLIPHLLGRDIRGRTLWDACAAPGGKTAVLCEKIGETGRVVASDIGKARVHRLKRHLEEAGCSNAQVLVADAGRRPPLNKCFDIAFVDVPCSGLGTLRRNPEIKWKFRSSEFPRLQKNQLSILSSVSENVRRGGRLLYSTCSTEPEENEQVVEMFLDSHHDFQIELPDYPPGIHAWTGSDSLVRTFPSSRGWDGFFAALMSRSR